MQVHIIPIVNVNMMQKRFPKDITKGKYFFLIEIKIYLERNIMPPHLTNLEIVR